MSKLTDQNKLSEIVVDQTRTNRVVADAFIGQLFSEIEKELISNSFIKLEGLGLFRVIKSGDKKRVLYLGSNSRINEEIDLSGVYSESNTDYNTNLPEDYTSENISFNSDHCNDKSANELFESFEDRYPQDTDVPLPLGAYASTEKAAPQQDYVYVANRKMNLIKTCVIALAILLLASIGYIAISGASDKPDEKELRETGFQELVNTDTLAFNKVVVPQVDVSVQYISRMYYGDDVYWPYIFMANKDAVNKMMVVRGGTKIRIPRISVDLAGLHDGTVQNSVQSLAKDIILVER